MDFLLTEKGDLLLEEVQKKMQPITLNFFVKSQSQAVCLKFEIEDSFITPAYSGLAVDFTIKRYETMYQAAVIDDLEALKQMCYNAIRTQKDSLVHAADYGSYYYKYKNQKVTLDLLKQLELIAKEAINDFAPEAIVEASAISTHNGQATIHFTIQIYRHALTLDYLI